MPEARKRPCSICRRWFRPDVRIGDRQHACGKPECQTTRRQKTQASWRGRNPGYAIAYRIDQRASQKEPEPEALRLPAPLTQLPWDLAKDQFGAQGADFIELWEHFWSAARKRNGCAVSGAHTPGGKEKLLQSLRQNVESALFGRLFGHFGFGRSRRAVQLA
jgi:hypothetical protein